MYKRIGLNKTVFHNNKPFFQYTSFTFKTVLKLLIYICLYTY